MPQPSALHCSFSFPTDGAIQPAYASCGQQRPFGQPTLACGRLHPHHVAEPEPLSVEGPWLSSSQAHWSQTLSWSPWLYAALLSDLSQDSVANGHHPSPSTGNSSPGPKLAEHLAQWAKEWKTHPWGKSSSSASWLAWLNRKVRWGAQGVPWSQETNWVRKPFFGCLVTRPVANKLTSELATWFLRGCHSNHRLLTTHFIFCQNDFTTWTIVKTFQQFFGNIVETF